MAFSMSSSGERLATIQMEAHIAKRIVEGKSSDVMGEADTLFEGIILGIADTGGQFTRWRLSPHRKHQACNQR